MFERIYPIFQRKGVFGHIKLDQSEFFEVQDHLEIASYLVAATEKELSGAGSDNAMLKDVIKKNRHLRMLFNQARTALLESRRCLVIEGYKIRKDLQIHLKHLSGLLSELAGLCDGEKIDEYFKKLNDFKTTTAISLPTATTNQTDEVEWI